MTRIIKNARASDLPISDIDRNAVVIMHCDEIGHTETTVQIQSGDEYIHIDPTSVSVSLDKSTASDLWKAYYLPMYYQVSILRSIMGLITRTTYIRSISTSGSMIITYRARNDNFTIEYQGKEYILTADSKKVTLRSKQPIKLLESPVFKVDSPMDTYNCYAMTVEVAEFIGQLSTGNSIFEWLQSIMGHAEEREKFLEWYKRKKK